MESHPHTSGPSINPTPVLQGKDWKDAQSDKKGVDGGKNPSITVSQVDLSSPRGRS